MASQIRDAIANPNANNRYSAPPIATRTEHDPQNPSDNAVVLIERLKKMAQRDDDRERLIHYRERRDKVPPYHARTVNVPMMKKV